jgi:hypothetical protein
MIVGGFNNHLPSITTARHTEVGYDLLPSSQKGFKEGGLIPWFQGPGSDQGQDIRILQNK